MSYKDLVYLNVKLNHVTQQSLAMTTPPEVNHFEILPLWNSTQTHMGDIGMDGLYHCYENINGMFVSHYKVRTYRQLKNHMEIMHEA